tara:strand:+ start:3408 stop:4148 length:741 start_codon:yes stop_codon:yes gene_type:complete
MKYIVYLGVAILICYTIYYLYFETNLIKQKIPKNIIQTWKTNEIPEKCINYRKSIKEKHPDYNFIFFNDEEIETFIQNYYPKYYETYKKLPIKIQKIDFFRYIAIYHYGGFYLDLDMFCKQSFDELLQYECVFPVDDYIDKIKQKQTRYISFKNQNQDFLLGQYAFGSVSQHPFLLEIIEGIHKNVNVYVKNINANSDDYIYQTTGPDYITQKYIDSKNKNNITILHAKRQHFGKYAKHMYMGSWK